MKSSLPVLLYERFALMKTVAANKWLNHKPISDISREESLLDVIANLANSLKLPIKPSKELFELLFVLSKDVQQSYFDMWEDGGFDKKRYDTLDEVRFHISNINAAMALSLAMLRKHSIKEVKLHEFDCLNTFSMGHTDILNIVNSLKLILKD